MICVISFVCRTICLFFGKWALAFVGYNLLLWKHKGATINYKYCNAPHHCLGHRVLRGPFCLFVLYLSSDNIYNLWEQYPESL